MNTETWVSGWPAEACRTALGDEALARLGGQWREPELLLQTDPGQLAGRQIVWLYRGPGQELLQAGEGASTAAVLDAWSNAHRSALNLRRGKPAMFSAVDLHGQDADALAERVPGLSVLPVVGDQARAPIAEALDRLLGDWEPGVGEVHSALIGAAPRGSKARPGSAPDASGLLEPLVQALRHGGKAGPRPALQAPPERTPAEELRIRAEQYSLQLQQVREELDLSYAHVRRVDAQLASREADWAEACRIRKDEESLLFQVQNLQEELEFQQIALQELAGLRERLNQATAANAAEKKSHANANAALAAENRSLRNQLQLVIDELRHASAPETVSAPVPLRQRLARMFRRKVMARLSPRWADAAEHEANRRRDLADLSSSRWFDRAWYLSQYPDVREAGLDPAEHFHDFGWSEGRDPGPGFSTRHYLEVNPDVAQSGMNPFLHFIRHGAREGRLPKQS